MSKQISLRAIFVAAAIILLLGAMAFITLQVNAQNQTANDIQSRLITKGVPVKSVFTISRVPYKVEITLNSQSKDSHLTVDDDWSMILAKREATLAYRIGPRMDSYRINVVNVNGKLIFSSDDFIYPDSPSQNIAAKQSLLNSQQAIDYVTGQLKTGDLQQTMIDVLPEDHLGSPGQILMIQLTATDVTSANQSFPAFINSLLTLFNTLKTKQGLNIVLCHVRMVNYDGSILFDFVQDLETGEGQWTGSKELTYNDWYPHPPTTIPPQAQSTPPALKVAPTTNSAVAYPAPSPSPTLTSTQHPYP